jgi:DNA polymerase-3 subunit gamma/tau
MPSEPKPGHLVFARKYRPQTLEEVVGQSSVTVTLKNALTRKKIAHAYLFTGSRGVGKTSVARILAKALNCQKGISAVPCGTCLSCKEIASSSSLDVLEMDAASNTGVDNVREAIIETVGLAPSRDRYKVFIVDEAHMLSTAAFNALLKTLEEPPAHVVFILATTESSKIPPTIASRCQRFRFRPLPVETLIEHLNGISTQEKIKAEPEALRQLAVAAEGSLRDAVGLLDQCRSYADGPITESAVREMFGLAPRELLFGLSEALINRDAAALANRLQQAYAQGSDLSQLLRDLRLLWEGIYRDRLGVESVKEDALKSVAKLATAATAGFILRRLNDALSELRSTDSPRLTCELALFSCLESATDLSQWLGRLEAMEKRLESGLPDPEPVATTMTFPSPQPASTARKSEKKEETEQAAPAHPAPRAAGHSPTNFLPGLIASLRAEKGALASALEQARVASQAGGNVHLSFARSFELEMVKRNMVLVVEKLSAVLGKPAKLTLEIGGKAEAESPDSKLEPEPAAPSEAVKGPAPTASTGIQKAQEILGGKIRLVKKQP